MVGDAGLAHGLHEGRVVEGRHFVAIDVEGAGLDHAWPAHRALAVLARRRRRVARALVAGWRRAGFATRACAARRRPGGRLRARVGACARRVVAAIGVGPCRARAAATGLAGVAALRVAACACTGSRAEIAATATRKIAHSEHQP